MAVKGDDVTVSTMPNTTESNLRMAERDIKHLTKGYHVEISFLESGGIATIRGCSECGTNPRINVSQSWISGYGETISTAIKAALKKV